MRLVLIAVLCGLAVPAGAAECLLEVNGVKYIDGPCEYEALDGLDFKIGVYPDNSSEPMRFAYVYVGGQSATGFWNGQPAESHAHAKLDNLRSSGACWIGASAKVCVHE